MKTVFLDRDGVINRNLDNGYVKSWSEFEFLPNSLGAIRLLANAGYQIIVVTNQACINKGILSPRTLDVIHQKMISDVERTGGRIHAAADGTSREPSSICHYPTQMDGLE